tara:strand:- start:306 stop:737 length:432 start_codon:yes stop_codon:yes gene_type:complete
MATIKDGRRQVVADGGELGDGVTIDSVDISAFKSSFDSYVASGGSQTAVTEITASDSPYSPSSSDAFVAVDLSGGAVTVQLPTPVGAGGRRLFVKDSKGSCAPGLKITITTAASTIDGASSFELTDSYQSISLISDGDEWLIH